MNLAQLDARVWLNTDDDDAITRGLSGKMVVVHAFQMLCPGCITHSLPQFANVSRLFAAQEIEFIALHTVFEHHQAMNNDALAACVSEFGYTFKIAVDYNPRQTGLPNTMQAWQLQGTPSLLIFDQTGQLLVHHFGRLSDLAIAKVISECYYSHSHIQAQFQSQAQLSNPTANTQEQRHCTDEQCRL